MDHSTYSCWLFRSLNCARRTEAPEMTVEAHLIAVEANDMPLEAMDHLERSIVLIRYYIMLTILMFYTF